MSKLSSKNQITIPVEVMRQAGLQPGDELRIRAAGDGMIEIGRAEDIIRRFAGSMPGVWPPNELEALRREWDR